jgi:hypothetical protein
MAYPQPFGRLWEQIIDTDGMIGGPVRHACAYPVLSRWTRRPGRGPDRAVPRGLAGACWITHAVVAKGAERHDGRCRAAFRP